MLNKSKFQSVISNLKSFRFSLIDLLANITRSSKGKNRPNLPSNLACGRFSLIRLTNGVSA